MLERSVTADRPGPDMMCLDLGVMCPDPENTSVIAVVLPLLRRDR